MLSRSKMLSMARRHLSSSTRRFAYPKKFFDMLNMMPHPCYTQMANGLTVASEERPGIDHVCVGLFVDGGSRYESKYENGIAHFFEHLAFRSTVSRPFPELQNQLSCTGARFKCFTQREFVGYYAECLSEDITVVVDLLSDCVFNNAMDAGDIERQKAIVYQEMIEKESDANQVLWDYLHGAAFMGTPLAQTVMGPTGNLQYFCEQNIRTYLTKFFDPTRTALVAVGGVCHEQLVDLAQCYLLKLEPSKCVDDVYRFTAGDIRFRDDTLPYCNSAIAFEAPCLCDSRSWAMEAAAMFLGGWDRTMTRGFLPAHHISQASFIANQAYGYRTFYVKYKDTGLWGIQFLAKNTEQDELVYNIQNQFMTLCHTITENEVDRARHELKTDLLTKLEGVTYSCIDLARWTLYNGRQLSLQEKLCEVDRLNAEEIKMQCDYFINDRCPAVASVGPCENLPCPSRLRAGQYWLRV